MGLGAGVRAPPGPGATLSRRVAVAVRPVRSFTEVVSVKLPAPAATDSSTCQLTQVVTPGPGVSSLFCHASAPPSMTCKSVLDDFLNSFNKKSLAN